MQSLKDLGDQVFKNDEKNDLCPSLSFRDRVLGFIACCCFGFFLSVMSWLAIFRRNWTLFGILMTAGNATTISGSLFLAGPMSQLKRMFEETRIFATGLFFVAMAMTLVCAVILKKPPLVIVCCIVQYFAMIWYGLSYIPYARTLVKKCCSNAIQL